MTTDTLQDYEALLESGFSEQQARAVVRIVAPARTDPEVLRRLDRIEQLLSTQSQVLEQHSQLLEQHSQMFQAILPLVQRIPAMEQEIAGMKGEIAGMKGEIGGIKGEIVGVKGEIGGIKGEIAEMREDIGELRANQYVIEERVKMEGRVSRMINATLIALGAIAASLVAAFAR